jgi:glutamyl-tRNA synthetase
LRIEDTDLDRSTQASVDVIIEGMAWLGLAHDEGPFYQMQRMDRYKAVLADLQTAGHVYPCYMSMEELDALRERQMANKEKPRYDGTWRPETGKKLPPIPVDRKPVVRFKSPQDGATAWVDLVKGPITFDNTELDDLVIARPDGTPTYNFCVVVDDWDMRITHVLRGDDHVNNTPRQITILRALGAPIPEYGHVPMILGPDGEKLSKRHGAVSVMEYDRDGYLPEGMINYLARLGWSHGDDELFTREQLVAWFDPQHLSKSAAQWDPKKLNWVNAHYIKHYDDHMLAKLVAPRVTARGGDTQRTDLVAVVKLLKDRAETLEQLAEAAMLFCNTFTPANDDLRAQHLTEAARQVLGDFAKQAEALVWNRVEIAALIKSLLTTHGLKMPQVAIPLRVAVAGTTQTPAIDAVLEILGKQTVLERIATAV